MKLKSDKKMFTITVFGHAALTRSLKSLPASVQTYDIGIFPDYSRDGLLYGKKDPL